MIVVIPAASASSTICGQMKCTWQSMPPAVRIRPSPATTSVLGPISSSGWTPSAMSGLPALPSATMRPSRTPTSQLDDAPVVEHDDVRDHEVGRALGGGRACPAASTRGSSCRRRTPPRRRRRSGPPRPRARGRCRPGARGRRPSARRARRSARGRSGSRAQPAGRARGARRRARRASRRARRPARSAPTSRRERRAGSPRRRAVEVERVVDVGEVEVRADLDRPVAGVDDAQRAASRGRR